MKKDKYQEFLSSGDSLRIYHRKVLVHSSRDKMLLPLLSYINTLAANYDNVVVFDKIIGNAAALLLTKIHCTEAYTPLASQPALETLDRFGISYKINTVVPFIQQSGSNEMCPMEKLSLGKTPEEFYDLVKGLVSY